MPRFDFERNVKRQMIRFEIMWWTAVVLNVALVAAVTYVVLHFIAKWW